MIVAAAILRMDAKNAWKIAYRDHKKDAEQKSWLANGGYGWRIAGAAWRSLGNTFLGDSLEPLTGDKILGALRIRDVTIVLWAILCVGVIVAVRLFFLPI